MTWKHNSQGRHVYRDCADQVRGFVSLRLGGGGYEVTAIVNGGDWLPIGSSQSLKTAMEILTHYVGQHPTDAERQVLALRADAPLRGKRDGAMKPQHDVSGLGLFLAANEPRLI